MRPFVVVFQTPHLDDVPGFMQVREPVVVQTLPPKQRVMLPISQGGSKRVPGLVG
jgi:hypothetical protein